MRRTETPTGFGLLLLGAAIGAATTALLLYERAEGGHELYGKLKDLLHLGHDGGAGHHRNGRASLRRHRRTL